MAVKTRAAVGGSIMMAGLLALSSASAEELDKLVFGTNWYAQAEHGGFYQALATGLYEDYGLDVEIRMGGPPGQRHPVAGLRSLRPVDGVSHWQR